MISSSLTSKTVIYPTSMDKADQAKETAFEMGGDTHAFVFDGKVEAAIVQGMIDPEKGFTSLDQLTQLCKDEKGGVAKAAHLLGEGAETVKVDVGLAEKWTAKATDKDGVIELTNGGGLYSDEQSVRIGNGYVSLNTKPTSFDPKESVTQKIVGKFNAGTGTITCVREEIEHTLTQDAPAPLAKPTPAICPAPVRPGEVATSSDVDAKVLDPVASQIGTDKVFSGFGDENLNRFIDWSTGKIDLPFGTPLQALPAGWQELGPFDSHSGGPGENYIVQAGPGGSFQTLTLDKEAGTAKLVTCHEYRRPTDFEGSLEQVTLTRYPDGEIRREFREMHD